MTMAPRASNQYTPGCGDTSKHNSRLSRGLGETTEAVAQSEIKAAEVGQLCLGVWQLAQQTYSRVV